MITANKIFVEIAAQIIALLKNRCRGREKIIVGGERDYSYACVLLQL